MLSRYGAALAGFHALAAVFWWREGTPQLLRAGSEVICWPLFPACGSLRTFSSGTVSALLAVYGVMAAACAASFLAGGPRRTRVAYFTLIALYTFHAVYLAADFRLRLNQHSMAMWAGAVFLFVPDKLRALRILLTLFYFWAGTLKLDRDWLSGAAVGGRIGFIEGPLLIAAAYYAVFLELVLAWGLLARSRGKIFWAVYAQLILFHLISWPVVGYFYPLAMVLLTSLLIAAPRVEASAFPRAPLAVAAVFSCFQLVPYLYPGDSALTGEGRLFALHMFDARVVCEAHAVLHKGGSTTVKDLRTPLPPRIACDPIIFHARAQHLCALREKNPALFDDLDLVISARRASDPADHLRSLADARAFCAHEVRYDPFFHNDWIDAD